jgi:hypothetical protein
VYALAALQYQLQQARTLYAPLSKMLGSRLISDYKVHLASVPGELYQIEQREYRVLPASSPENRVSFDVVESMWRELASSIINRSPKIAAFYAQSLQARRHAGMIFLVWQNLSLVCICCSDLFLV